MIHNTARFEYLCLFSQTNYLVFNKRHENPGGRKLKNNEGAQFPIIYTPLQITNQMLAWVQHQMISQQWSGFGKN